MTHEEEMKRDLARGRAVMSNEWKMVPVEPTDEMISAVIDLGRIDPEDAECVWAGMLEAAPPQPEHICYRYQHDGAPGQWFYTRDSRYYNAEPVTLGQLLEAMPKDGSLAPQPDHSDGFVAEVKDVLGYPIIEWRAADYPVGTKLYTRPDHSAQPIGFISQSTLDALGRGEHVPATICSGAKSRKNQHPGPDASWQVPIYAQSLDTAQEDAQYQLADKVREALDRKACPNTWMVIAYEAVVENFTHADAGEVERLRGDYAELQAESWAHEGVAKSLCTQLEAAKAKLAEAKYNECLSCADDAESMGATAVAIYLREFAEKKRAHLSATPSPPKQKACPECDQSHCHGVCVERGDEHYDRDHAGKGGDNE